MKKLGVGIIGCGSVAEEYVKAAQQDERSEVRALVSRNRANAERYREKPIDGNNLFVPALQAVATLRRQLREKSGQSGLTHGCVERVALVSFLAKARHTGQIRQELI